MVEVLTFEDALGMSTGAKRHLLLGNGFSRACRNDIFAYEALYSQVKEELSDRLKQAFQTLDTNDFEILMKVLEQASDLVPLYDPEDKKLCSELLSDAETLREMLAHAIAGNHPKRPNEILDEEYRACRTFLSNFETYYSVNYDLLLYWTLMHDDLDEIKLPRNDGFHEPEEGKQDYVVWEITDRTRQNVYYLHGALHLYDVGSEVHKYTWCNTGIPLLDQIKDALSKRKYPIYVAEGTSESKKERILHNAYLSKGYRSMPQISGSLFVYGLSFSENDSHITKPIVNGQVKKLFVSLYGDPNSPTNQEIITRSNALSKMREDSKKSNNLEVFFYDAESTKLWG